MDRKQFLKSCGMGAVGAAVASALGVRPGVAADAGPTHTCGERIDFAERWAGRFMKVLDETVDEPTRVRLMQANGKACFEQWLQRSGTVIEPLPFADWVRKIEAAGPREDVRVEGNTVYFQFTGNVKGQPAPEGFCLCDLMESKPKGISPTYCECSVGYVRELFGRRFGRPVTVALLESVLRGGRRCRFRIDVA